MRSYSMAKLVFFIYLVKIWFLEKDFESPLIFVLFFKGKTKQERKTLSVTPYLEKQVCEKPSQGLGVKLLIGKAR